MEYFKVPEANPGDDGICSDNDCPCGHPGARIPRGSGYMYISKEVVDFRRDARTVQEAEQKIALMRQRMGRFITFGQNVITSTLMCEQGARKRGLNLNVAAADAKYWWETGSVPLRATPLAGSTEVRQERARLKSRVQSSYEKRPAASPAKRKPITSFSQLYFSFDGRIGRQTFWLRGFLPIIAISFVVGLIDSLAEADGILMLIWQLMILWPSLALTVKRWHDRDKSGWWILISLIPIIGVIWAFIETGFLEGSYGSNRFGSESF